MSVESLEFVAIVSCSDSVVCCCTFVASGMMIVGGTAEVVGSVVGDICLEVVFVLVVFVGMMFDVEIVVFVVLDVGSPDMVVCAMDEAGNMLVNVCVVFDSVGVTAIVNAGDVGCGFLRAAK